MPVTIKEMSYFLTSCGPCTTLYEVDTVRHNLQCEGLLRCQEALLHNQHGPLCTPHTVGRRFGFGHTY